MRQPFSAESRFWQRKLVKYIVDHIRDFTRDLRHPGFLFLHFSMLRLANSPAAGLPPVLGFSESRGSGICFRSCNGAPHCAQASSCRPAPNVSAALLPQKQHVAIFVG